MALGVSFNDDFVEKALESNADLLLVHHGIFAKGNFKLRGFLKRRVEKVIKNNLNLMGYHLPLDMNEEYGNNITILNKLGLKKKESYSYGFIGEYEKEIDYDIFKIKLKNIFTNQEFIEYKNNNFVKNVCIISGGASGEIFGLEEKNVDTYITGQIEEFVRNTANEMNMNYIYCGHYATEVFGVKSIGKLLKDKFNLEIEFIDVYNKI